MPSLFASGRDLAFSIEKARPGAVVIYHRGRLSDEAYCDAQVRDVAKMARRLSNMTMPRSETDQSIEHGMGVGTLAQFRLGEGQFEYRFIKKRLGGRR